ncbi:ABC transporter substrate-binding protein [Roseateles sp. BYS78W]|uniref:ABC transporter substrate-binding protein n=1 Tax=Pelomonas candidula TaxID=3299025 RepID=A0ABW7HJA6_9BURK
MRSAVAGLAVSMLCSCAAAQIVIGQTTGITGVSAANVKETLDGQRLWIDAINAKGGINGQKIEVVTLDDQGDTRLAQANARRLIEERHVLALFMVRGTPQNEAILPLLEKHGVPLVAPSSGAMTLRKPTRPYVFNVRSSYQDEAEKAIHQLASMGVSRIAVLKTRDSFGDDAMQGAERGFHRIAVKPLLVGAFDKAKPEFAGIARQVADGDAQAVLVIGAGASVAQFVEVFRATGSKAYVVTLSNNASSGFVTALGANAHGVIVTQVFPSERSSAIPMIKEAMDLLRRKGLGELSPAMVEGFAGARVLVEGLKRAGSRPTRASLRQALEDMSSFDLGGLVIRYSPIDHTGLQYTDLSVIDSRGGFRR